MAARRMILFEQKIGRAPVGTYVPVKVDVAISSGVLANRVHADVGESPTAENRVHRSVPRERESHRKPRVALAAAEPHLSEHDIRDRSR
jgi:hypothetical protein